MDVFRYDFGYAWPWNYGHLVAVVAFGVLAMFAWRRGLPRWIGVLSLGVAVWGVVGLLIVQHVVRMNLPLELPTERFLTEASGHVLDAGAGSGRAALMVLLSRPNSRVRITKTFVVVNTNVFVACQRGRRVGSGAKPRLGRPRCVRSAKARTARLVGAESGSRGPREASAWGSGRSPV